LVSPHSHNRPDMNLPWSARTDLFEMNILSFCCTWSAVLCIKLCIAAPTLQWPFKSHSVQIQLQPFSGQRNSSHSSVAGQVTCTHARNSIFIIKNHLQSLQQTAAKQQTCTLSHKKKPSHLSTKPHHQTIILMSSSSLLSSSCSTQRPTNVAEDNANHSGVSEAPAHLQSERISYHL